MLKLLLLGAAGLLGTLARYCLTVAAARRYGESFPFGTLAVNVIGCFLIGLLFYLFEARLPGRETMQTIVLVGFLGSFTTFSSYGLQLFVLLREGEVGRAALYMGLSNVLGVILVWCGFAAGRGLGGAS
jgi:fluoride exporter